MLRSTGADVKQSCGLDPQLTHVDVYDAAAGVPRSRRVGPTGAASLPMIVAVITGMNRYKGATAVRYATVSKATPRTSAMYAKCPKSLTIRRTTHVMPTARPSPTELRSTRRR
jgi:hypothetical protein